MSHLLRYPYFRQFSLEGFRCKKVFLIFFFSVGTVETAAQPSATLQREEWMTMPLGPSDRALSIMTEKKRENDTELQEIEKDVSLHFISVRNCILDNFGDCVFYG